MSMRYARTADSRSETSTPKPATPLREWKNMEACHTLKTKISAANHDQLRLGNLHRISLVEA